MSQSAPIAPTTARATVLQRVLDQYNTEPMFISESEEVSPDRNNSDYFANLPLETLRIISYGMGSAEVERLCLSSERLSRLCSEDYWHDRLVQRYPKYLLESNGKSTDTFYHDYVAYLDLFTTKIATLGFEEIDVDSLSEIIMTHPYDDFYFTHPWLEPSFPLTHETSVLYDIALSYFPLSKVIIVQQARRESFIKGNRTLDSIGKAVSQDALLSTINKSERDYYTPTFSGLTAYYVFPIAKINYVLSYLDKVGFWYGATERMTEATNDIAVEKTIVQLYGAAYQVAPWM